MQIDVVVEIPKGTRNKYEADEHGNLWLDRYLYTPMAYPVDYGHVDDTLAEDGDPIDAMVLLPEPTFPGCHIKGRVVGMYMMSDENGVDEKLLCVPEGDHRWDWIQDVTDVPDNIKDEIDHFFTHYKDLEPNKHVEPGGWQSVKEATARYDQSVERFRQG